MARLIITDGIGLIKLSPVQRCLLGRRYLAFELDRVLKVSVQNTPKRADFGERTKHGWVPFSWTGEYQTGLKRTLFIGPKKSRCVRVLMLNPALDEICLTTGNQLELYAILKEHQKDKIYPRN
jgi:hypothetical protein